MAYRWTFNLVSIVALCVEIAGCGAFADAASHDGGQNGSSTRLLFDKTPYVLQGQRKDFKISFAEPPVWSGMDGGRGFLTVFRFVDEDTGNVLSDIQFIAEYDSDNTIVSTVQASSDADTQIRRTLEIEVAYEKTGQHQLHYKGTGAFWVLPKTGAQDMDGNDGNDADGGTE